jgi:hypothetical protein
VKTHFEHNTRLKSQRLADLKKKAAELERQLSAARVSLERELRQYSGDPETAPGHVQSNGHYTRGDADPGYDAQAHSPQERTEVLVNHGRRSAYYSRLSWGRKAAIGTAVLAAAVTILVVAAVSGGASWPASVATVQSAAAKACQNPDVKSEPGQVNFACAKSTRQILWVFALLTSADNPNFADAKTGRLGLEPITPTQGGEMAWSLNLHHPYDPSNPVDSIAVAARAINNIIGGATLTGAEGNTVIQAGLEGYPANCVRYTGAAAVTSHAGFPRLCAKPVTSAAGQAALVADVYQKWVVGATPKSAQDAATLFENANNPGDPSVQLILKHLPVQNG